ncbi:unnamed protein product [Closterium sp. NIES-65]|nr:unnamed protein product [Closterium sp. NIES-65]
MRFSPPLTSFDVSPPLTSFDVSPPLTSSHVSPPLTPPLMSRLSLSLFLHPVPAIRDLKAALTMPPSFPYLLPPSSPPSLPFPLHPLPVPAINDLKTALRVPGSFGWRKGASCSDDGLGRFYRGLKCDENGNLIAIHPLGSAGLADLHSAALNLRPHLSHRNVSMNGVTFESTQKNGVTFESTQKNGVRDSLSLTLDTVLLLLSYPLITTTPSFCLCHTYTFPTSLPPTTVSTLSSAYIFSRPDPIISSSHRLSTPPISSQLLPCPLNSSHVLNPPLTTSTPPFASISSLPNSTLSHSPPLFHFTRLHLSSLCSLILNSDLSWNSLYGPIPPYLINHASLTKLWLFDSKLTGPIPPFPFAAFFFLPFPASPIPRLYPPPPLPSPVSPPSDLSWNSLYGPIPPYHATFTKLWQQAHRPHPPLPYLMFPLSSLPPHSLPPSLPPPSDLSWNSLYGPIPSHLINHATLTKLWLFDNKLTGPIPPYSPRLSSLLLFKNFLTGRQLPLLHQKIHRRVQGPSQKLHGAAEPYVLRSSNVRWELN